jgi:hypothetical protein
VAKAPSVDFEGHFVRENKTKQTKDEKTRFYIKKV